MPRQIKFHLHADNIVECERTLNLMSAALGEDLQCVNGPIGSVTCPSFLLHRLQGLPLSVTFFPGFGRWNEDVLKLIRDRGGTLREAADAIISRVHCGKETPLLAIEYCGALPAGNQAWQRNGRAYSFGRAKVPYVYVAELGGFELDSNRNRKAARMPNPAVPFSYLAYSIERGTPVLPVFVTSPGADGTSRNQYSDVFADSELVSLVRGVMLGKGLDMTLRKLHRKVLKFVMRRAETSRKGETLSPSEWEEAHRAVTKGKTLVEYILANHSQPWSKTAYIASLTDTARSLMDMTARHAIGLSSTKLPICVVRGKDRPAFASAAKRIYGNLPPDFVNWLARDGALVICWVMGFKPRGDDARPDRGLPPFARMLASERHDLLTVVYGPAKKSTWPLLRDEPKALMERNGLWEAILDVSDALLVDAITDDVTNHGFVRAHWESAIPAPRQRSIVVVPEPQNIGENDVDTVLHLLLARCAGPNVFEGMCNPPGGDWSGVSLQPKDRTLELRWVSLPRVSGSDTKRPDHVFQIFGLGAKPIILSVESKETANAVEHQIGPRLVSYLRYLITSPASIERSEKSAQWNHSSRRLEPKEFAFMSAVAFMPKLDVDIENVSAKAQADLVLGFRFSPGGRSCEIELIPNTDLARKLVNFIAGLDLTNTRISLKVDRS